MKRIAPLAAAFALVGLTVTGPAWALSRTQANALALRTLRPQKQGDRVVLFGLRAPLAPTQSLTIASIGHEGDVPEKRGRPLGRRTWLYWEDLAYDAKFEHASKLLLIDDSTGQTRTRSLLWFPLVDGRKPPFLLNPAAYASSRYIVYSSVRLAPAARVVAQHSQAALPAGGFADDCLIMIGRFSDPSFEQDFTGMADFGKAAGLRTYWTMRGSEPSTTRPPPDKEGGQGSLEENINWLIEHEHCRDVFIFADGHGAKAPEPAEIDLGRGGILQPSALKRIFAKHPEVTFKLKLDTCYAGRFLEPQYDLKQPNLLVAEASSRADEVSWSKQSDPRDRNGEPIVRKLPNPGRSEFANANLAGLEHFTSSNDLVSLALVEGGDLLAHALADAFYDGAGSDAARIAGLTHPILYTNFPNEAPHALPGYGFQLLVGPSVMFPGDGELALKDGTVDVSRVVFAFDDPVTQTSQAAIITPGGGFSLFQPVLLPPARVVFDFGAKPFVARSLLDFAFSPLPKSGETVSAVFITPTGAEGEVQTVAK